MNINLDDLEKIIALAERSNIQSLEVVDGTQRIQVVCHAPESDTSLSETSAPSLNQADSITTPSTLTGSESDNVVADASNSTPSTANSSIIAPMMGTFYLRSDPSADVFFNEGDSVKAGDTLCVIEAMKIMHEVKAEEDCIIEKILVKEGDVVEFDQPLFETHAL